MAVKRKIAVCGKGGVGKTAFTAMLTRCMTERKDTGRILVVDADPAVGLPTALGLACHRTMAQIRDEIISGVTQGDRAGRRELASKLDYMIMDALVEGDGFAFLAMGRSEGKGCFCTVNELLRMALEILTEQFDTIIIDGEAGLEQISRQVTGQIDDLIILTDASRRGRETIEHIMRMALEEEMVRCRRIGVVLNHVPQDIEEKMLIYEIEAMRLCVYGVIPEDPTITAYDVEGKALIKLPGNNQALRCVREISGKIYV